MRRLLLLLTMLVLPGVAHAEWREASTPHFLIYSQESEKALRERAERLEAFHHLLMLAYGMRAEPHPYKVRLYVVGSTDSVQKYMEKPDKDVAGFYRSLPSGPIAFTPQRTESGDGDFNPQVVLFHEYTHHFMLQNLPVAYPPWFVEGRAELMSTASFERSGMITYGKAANHRQYELDGTHPLASKLLLKPSEVSTGTGLDYGASWLLTHYLSFAPARNGQLARYLGAINAGTDPQEAAKVFGDLRTLDRDVSKYLEARSFTYRQVPIPPEIGQQVAIRTLAADETAMLPLVMEFTKPMKDAEAKAFMARVDAAAAAYPNSVAALKLKADVDLDTGALDAAQAAADRAVALAPEDARAHYLRGAVGLARAGKDDAGGHAIALAARKEIVAANRLDPEDPLPLIAYFRSFGVAGEPAPEVAIEGLAKAAQIVPQDSGTRLTYASVLIARGKKPDAAALLRPLAYEPHADGASKVAQQMLARLEGREAGDPNDIGNEPDPPAAKPK